MSYSQSDVGIIETMLLKHVRDAFVDDESIDREWRRLNYTEKPDLSAAMAEYDRFVGLLEGFGIGLSFLPQDPATGLDSVYVRDSSVVCSKGLIVCRPGKTQRRGEAGALERASIEAGVRIAGRIREPGTLEGGDVVWLDERTVAVGRSHRTNDAGIRQLQSILGGMVDEVIVVPLPHWRGTADVFHLMSVLSPIDRDLALVYSPLLPIPFREYLVSRGLQLIEVPDSEFHTMGANVLAVGPRQCVALAGNPRTRRRLEAAGVAVHTYRGDEISVKGAGGPTCLTRPLGRR